MSDKHIKKIHRCNDVFDSVDNSCKVCFKKFLKDTPECIDYTIEKIYSYRIIYDKYGNIITKHNPGNKVYLLDYVFDSGTTRFLKPLIDMGAPHITNNIQNLFELLDVVDPNECEEEPLSKHVKHTSKAILAALRSGWYHYTIKHSKGKCSFKTYSPYILIISRNRWIFKCSYHIDIYKSIIIELLNHGELVLDRYRSKIKNYLIVKSQQIHFPYKLHDDYIEEIVEELYSFSEDNNILEVKGVVDE